MSLSEFEIIRKYFKSAELALKKEEILLGIGDDAAILDSTTAAGMNHILQRHFQRLQGRKLLTHGFEMLFSESSDVFTGGITLIGLRQQHAYIVLAEAQFPAVLDEHEPFDM